MKQTTVMNTAAGALAALLLGSMGLAWAQNLDPHTRAGIQTDADNAARGRRRTINRGPSDAEVDAWNRRETEVQARIARFRATPYWMVIGRDWEKSGFIWSGVMSQSKGRLKKLSNSADLPTVVLLLLFLMRAE